jgi:pimeloyl-ACP methyl ester carboxylesterase
MATVETAKTQFVDANGIKFAYREIGPHSMSSSTPLVFLQHFRGTIDHWDPDLVNPIAQKHPVILFDNAGVGHSTGLVPDSVAGMAENVVAFLDALTLKEIYLYGFSLGGMVAQQVTITTLARKLVKKAMFVGTSPGSGPATPPGTLEMPPDVAGLQENAGAPETKMENIRKLFFHESPTSIAASTAYWERIHRRNVSTSGEERAPYLPVSQNLMNMTLAGRKWSTGEGILERIHEIDIPVFISNGFKDFMLPTQHSWMMNRELPNSVLVVYPDSGHGAGFQHAKRHAGHILDFLRD